ncbi:MAG: ferritin-like domain-containing protein [Rubrobacteraceae bacterium]|nr:ferritin-like domain-containing protein [Rubrobacteraceae bacterium]
MSEGTYLDEHAEGSFTSRRKFLAGSAAALAGGALMAVPGVASAHNPPNPPTDIDILNYALTLERLEKAFYRRVLERFSEKQFENAGIFDGLGNYLRRNAYENFQRISNHEDTHVKTLVSIIESLHGKPVPASEYNFGITSVASAVRTARVLENTGVRAYDGAIAHIFSAEYLTAGATIATVEARHASYLNLLNKAVPFPSAFDKAVAPKTICEDVQAFITSSPKPYGPYRSLNALCRRLPTKPTP